MTEKTYKTPSGTIHYWTGGPKAQGRALVFLPGLTADHRLFDKQLAYFEEKHPVFVWDAPGHAASWPFRLTFSLPDLARWLDQILAREGISSPVIIGQSMGGYIGQAYAQLFPEKLAGFVSIDSAPLQRHYMAAWELWSLKHTETMYRLFPWRLLLRSGASGTATSPYGRALTREMMLAYDGDQRRYARLAGHGFRILAEAVEADLPYRLDCPALLLCGEKDRAGAAIRYNRAWHKEAGLPLEWIKGAGHNANTDAPETVNALIEGFLQRLPSAGCG